MIYPPSVSYASLRDLLLAQGERLLFILLRAGPAGAP